MPPSNAPKISIIVPVYNGGEKFRQCLSSLAKLNPAPLEIIIVADGGSDGSAPFAEKMGMRVLRLAGPSGPAKARNYGARRAQGDILYFLDADVTVEPAAIQKLLAAFQRDPALAAVMGSYDDAPGEANFLSQYRNLLHHYVHQTGHEEASTFWGACGAIRREIFLEMDGFDENYRQPCIEDVELGYRLKKAGYRIRLEKALRVKHLKRWEALSMLKTDFFQRALPWTELILRDRHMVNDLNLKPSSRISVLLSFGSLGSGIWGIWRPAAFVFAAVGIIILFALNAPLYRFFRQQRGFGFMLRVLPWHGLYFLSSGLAFIVGVMRFYTAKSSCRKR